LCAPFPDGPPDPGTPHKDVIELDELGRCSIAATSKGIKELVSVEVLSPRGSLLASDFYRLVEDLLAEIGQLAGEGVDRLDQSIAKLPTLLGVERCAAASRKCALIASASHLCAFDRTILDCQ